ncbi:hypothetical protein [Streptomyces shenzhenensis]|uniref:hypothetical protein n=1 Tax=Streptomyces shenzhenensis TaxID=943815 RepID=UPI0015F045E7|nr:hypothetical protein [Streptomyces shenzhenensis]
MGIQLLQVRSAWYRARPGLAEGAWLRRRRRVTEARELLRSAQRAFSHRSSGGCSMPPSTRTTSSTAGPAASHCARSPNRAATNGARWARSRT